MDVYISEEYVAKRRRERMRLRAEGGGHRAAKTAAGSEGKGEPERRGRVWPAPPAFGFRGKERVGEVAGAGEGDVARCEEVVFNCLSA